MDGEGEGKKRGGGRDKRGGDEAWKALESRISNAGLGEQLRAMLNSAKSSSSRHNSATAPERAARGTPDVASVVRAPGVVGAAESIGARRDAATFGGDAGEAGTALESAGLKISDVALVAEVASAEWLISGILAVSNASAAAASGVGHGS